MRAMVAPAVLLVAVISAAPAAADPSNPTPNPHKPSTVQIQPVPEIPGNSSQFAACPPYPCVLPPMNVIDHNIYIRPTLRPPLIVAFPPKLRPAWK